jgi:hypothetical protein
MSTCNLRCNLGLANRFDSLIISDNYSKLFGHKLSNRANFIKIKEFNTLVHPEDLPRVMAKART